MLQDPLCSTNPYHRSDTRVKRAVLCLICQTKGSSFTGCLGSLSPTFTLTSNRVKCILWTMMISILVCSHWLVKYTNKTINLKVNTVMKNNNNTTNQNIKSRMLHKQTQNVSLFETVGKVKDKWFKYIQQTLTKRKLYTFQFLG